MRHQHTVRSFAEELRDLKSAVCEMGGRAEAQLAQAMEALAGRDAEQARRVIARDAAIDKLEAEIESAAINILALRAPVADDLREIVSALKISGIVERIGDYAANVAKRSTVLTQSAVTGPIRTIREMARLAQDMVKDALDAYADRDREKAIDVWNRDQRVDEIYNSLFRELLTYMMDDPGNISASIHLLFIAKNIERIGDHATNLAEIVYYLVCGRTLDAARPKSDITSFTHVDPPGRRDTDGRLE